MHRFGISGKKLWGNHLTRLLKWCVLVFVAICALFVPISDPFDQSWSNLSSLKQNDLVSLVVSISYCCLQPSMAFKPSGMQ